VDLNLQGNALTTLPEGYFSTLLQLEALTLTGNKIAQLPRDMGLCERLQTLYAGANDIVDAAPAFDPPCIIHAGLAHNKIAALPPPEVMARAEAMLSLDLTHNNLTSLPDTLEALAHMPALRSLSLAGNPLALVPGYKVGAVQVWGLYK
jgi:Leucine-rich repeat (LRR) protein